MEKDHADMHIVINEDLIDLRQESFETQSLKIRFPQNPHKTTSHQILSSQNPGQNKDRKPVRLNGLKKLASNLQSVEQSNLSQKNKTSLRNKQRGRATSADPRFRRERSPVHSKKANQTQSDSQVVDSPLQYTKKNKTHSDSEFILDSPHYARKTMIPKPYGTSDRSEPINRHTYVKRISPRAEECVRKSITDKTSSVKYSTISHIYSCEESTPSNMEQSTRMEDVKDCPESVDCKMLYKMGASNTDETPQNVKKTEPNKTVGTHVDEEHLKPYRDNRTEKQPKLLKPVHIRKSKSSFALPSTSKTANCTTVHPACRKCVCRTLPEVYKAYQNISDETINYDNIKTKVYNAVSSNYYLALFFMIGSFCGLILVALVVWVLANDIIWSYMDKQEPPGPTGLKWLTTYLSGAILHGVNVVLNTIYTIIFIPRNQVFDIFNVEDA